MSINTYYFPSAWKIAKVTHIRIYKMSVDRPIVQLQKNTTQQWRREGGVLGILGPPQSARPNKI